MSNVKILIDQQQVDLPEKEIPLDIAYRLEDIQDFQTKKSSEALSIELPATTKNDQIFNTFHNPSIQDLTPGEQFRSARKVVIEANGHEVLVGKCFLNKVVSKRSPETYEIDCYGNNGDWMIDLRETTLYELLKHISFTFNKQLIIDSWDFDGTDEALPFVFAPVRYAEPFYSMYANLVAANPPLIDDYNCGPEYMRPSVSVYWLIYWGFKKVGFRINSDFMNTPYFRRLVMPWTWGNFLYSEGTKTESLKFLAKGESVFVNGDNAWQTWDLKVSNDSTNGAYDNQGVYDYDAVGMQMRWTYLSALNYGNLIANFHLQLNVDAAVTQDSRLQLRIQWFKNGVRFNTDDPKETTEGVPIVDIDAPLVGRDDEVGIIEVFQLIPVSPGDVITARFRLWSNDTVGIFGGGFARIRAEVITFEIDYFRIPIGGTISFENFSGLKKYKFLDFLRGVIDTFNLAIQTDSISKEVLIEPLHTYQLGSVSNNGYLNGNLLDWSAKRDVSRNTTISAFRDYEREVTFKFKEDNADGILKVIQDRHQNTAAASKYVFPDRFKAGKREVENRFFSPVMHFEAEQWKGLGSDPSASPQLIVMMPENVSNTSKSESQFIFSPKLAYYKGLVTNVGWVFDRLKQTTYPFMFAVNYQPGGENDPVLSYCDERIGEGSVVVATGLFKKFFLQRMANMRNGQNMEASFRLRNYDVMNWYHREHIIVDGNKYELVEIVGFQPAVDGVSTCRLRKWEPVLVRDANACYPAPMTVTGSAPNPDPFEVKYFPLKCLVSDLKK